MLTLLALPLIINHFQDLLLQLVNHQPQAALSGIDLAAIPVIAAGLDGDAFKVIQNEMGNWNTYIVDSNNEQWHFLASAHQNQDLARMQMEFLNQVQLFLQAVQAVIIRSRSVANARDQDNLARKYLQKTSEFLFQYNQLFENAKV